MKAETRDTPMFMPRRRSVYVDSMQPRVILLEVLGLAVETKVTVHAVMDMSNIE
jgi:hypothetical protein